MAVNNLHTARAIFAVDVARHVSVATLPYSVVLTFVAAVANMLRTRVNLYLVVIS